MSEETRAGTKERSPNFPALGLTAAIEAARKLWQREKRTQVPPDVAATALGYGSLSGASRAALAALRQYGLLDGGPGSVGVSDLAVDILVHDEGSSEWSEAVRKAATEPPMFAEIMKSHPDASDSALNAYLISKRRFSADGAQRFIRSYRDTISLVNRASQGYDQARSTEPIAQGDAMSMPSAVSAPQLQPGQQITVVALPLTGWGRVEIRFIGEGAPKPSHYRKIKSQMDLLLDDDADVTGAS